MFSVAALFPLMYFPKKIRLPMLLTNAYTVFLNTYFAPMVNSFIRSPLCAF